MKVSCLGAVLVTATLVAGCGSSGGDSSSSSPAASTSTPASTSTATSSAPVAAKKVKVEIKDFDYSPRKITVATGARVSWTNEDEANHTVTFDANNKDLGNQNKGSTKSFHFTKAGTFKYHCDFHPNMHGTVVVK